MFLHVIFISLAQLGCPIPVVGSWVIARARLDDVLCWTTHNSPNLFLIIRIPIIISIVVRCSLLQSSQSRIPLLKYPISKLLSQQKFGIQVDVWEKDNLEDWN